MNGKLLIVILLVVLIAGAGIYALSTRAPSNPADIRVFVLGCDGMDPNLMADMMDKGELPNFRKLRDTGTFLPLATSTPPQSPVAWSDFTTGADARVHNIFDFIHRHADDVYVDSKGKSKHRIAPFLSTTETYPPDEWMTVSDCAIPDLWAMMWGTEGAGGVRQLRRGTPFWNYLTLAGVPVTIFRLPANYPPGESEGAHFCCLSGMGVPDFRGTYGEFALYTINDAETRRKPSRGVSGGAFYQLGVAAVVEHDLQASELDLLTDKLREKLHYDASTQLLGFNDRLSTSDIGALKSIFKDEKDQETLQELLNKSRKLRSLDDWTGWLIGPPNDMRVSYREAGLHMETPFRVSRDPEADVASIEVGDDVLVLNKGEWSDWTRIDFNLDCFGEAVPAIARFYLLEVHPDVRLYVTPLNIDPENPALQISTPNDYAADVAAATGLYYTQGIPEDHSGLSEKALTDEEYMSQADIVLKERFDQLDFTLERFNEGLLFFYFGSTDQVAHVMWRHRDPDHPIHEPEMVDEFGDVINNIYKDMDIALGKIMEHMRDDDLLIVMSDHGFTSFRYGFNLNTWLRDNGYAVMKKSPIPVDNLLINTDWTKTKAYGFGINCLYVNLKGREFSGIVNKGKEYDELLDELVENLKAYRDPRTGDQVIADVYRVDKIYPGADPNIAPDLIVGYADNYRASWATILGEMPDDIVEDNMKAWSGDHCVAPHIVPGVLFSNRKLPTTKPRLMDVAPTILNELGVKVPDSMIGKPLNVANQESS